MLHSFTTCGEVRRLYDPSGLAKLAAWQCGYPASTDHAELDGLEQLCQAFEAARPCLTAFGKLHAQAILLAALSKRLRLTDYLQRFPEIGVAPLPDPVFIVAPFRTGSTFLHRLLSCDPDNRCPRLWEVAYPPPADPVGRGNRRYFTEDARIAEAASALRMLHRASPSLSRLHPMGPDLAEECFGLLETSFLSHSFMFYAELPSYLTWLEARTEAHWHDAYQIYANQLRLLHWWYPGRRLILKAPVHLWNLDVLLQIFPRATVIQLHRDPNLAMSSFSRLLGAYRALLCRTTDSKAVGDQASSYMRPMLRRAVAARCRADARRFIDVGFEDLIRDPFACVRAIYTHIGGVLEPEAASAMSDWILQQKPTAAGLETHRLDRNDMHDMFADYDSFLPVS